VTLHGMNFATFVLTAIFQANLVSWFSSVFFLHVFQKQTFGDKWHRVFTG